MTRHDEGARLRHMLDAAREAVGFARGKTRADLHADRGLPLLLTRLLELVGGARRTWIWTWSGRPSKRTFRASSLRSRRRSTPNQRDMESFEVRAAVRVGSNADRASWSRAGGEDWRSRWKGEAGCPWAGDAGGYRRLIRNHRRGAVAGGGGEEGGVGGLRARDKRGFGGQPGGSARRGADR